jgi:hypothetical protein
VNGSRKIKVFIDGLERISRIFLFTLATGTDA